MAKSDKIEITAQQQQAIDMLVSGASITDAAAQLGIARQTLSAWANHEPAFQAAMNERRQEIWALQSDKIRALSNKALDVMGRALDSKDLTFALKAAQALLTAIAAQQPTGATSAAEIEQERTLREKERLIKLREQEAHLQMRELLAL